MTDAAHPQVFISHSSRDKDRFVLGFARRLREAAVDAWVDRWEMVPGDRLAQKIFEEGLGKADCIIAVVSEHSIESPWVREELYTAKVRQIEEKCRLIPVIIGAASDEQIPMALRSALWVRVEDLQNYDVELERVVAGIYGRADKPPLGHPPAYVSSAFETIPGLSRTDSQILKILGDLAIEQGEAKLLIDPELIFERAEELEIGQERTEESLTVLADDGLLALPRAHGRGTSGILAAHLTEDGFETYLDSYLDGYEELARSVGYELANHSQAAAHGSDELAERLGAPVAVVRHVLRMLASNDYASIHEADGGRVFVIQVKPRLRRWLEQPAE